MNQPAPVPLSSDSGYDLADAPLDDFAPRAGLLAGIPVADVPEPDDPSLDPELIKTVETGNGPALQAAAAAAVSAAAAMATEPSAATISNSQAPATAQVQTPQAQPQPQPAAKPEGPKGPKLVRKRRPPKRKWDLPAWVVSALVHAAILLTLGAMTISTEVAPTIKNLDGTTAGRATTSEAPDTVLYHEASEAPSELAVGDLASTTSGFTTSGGGAPSATPAVGGSAVGPRVGERTSLPQIKIAAPTSGISMLPARPTFDLGGGGMVGGDPLRGTPTHEVALDQIAQEILRHLEQHKVMVAWMFDESESMRDDQKIIRSKFDRVTKELKEHSTGVAGEKAKKSVIPPLTHTVIGFGADVHLELDKPTADIDQVARAIDHLRVEPSGVENTFRAVAEVIKHYAPQIKKDRKLLIVLVTDESGDDGTDLEEARQLAASYKVPIYVMGRQSMFGYPFTRVRYVDPVTKDEYYPTIRRGPETADVETLQWDGLHDRWEEQPAGFAPYELARLTKETGGIYFLLPTTENMRIHAIEKAYSMDVMKEYVPDYESRVEYAQRRNGSELRKTLGEIIFLTRSFSYRRHFPVDQAALREAAEQEYPIVRERLAALVRIEERLRQLQKLRDREPEKRWQAAYDLMLAEIVTYQIKAYEYIACLKEMVAKPPVPSKLPSAERIVEWVLDHSKDRKAPKNETEKKYAEAERLLKQVMERHPKTPWADLARIELERGLGVQRNEWSVNAQYNERAKLMPKY